MKSNKFGEIIVDDTDILKGLYTDTINDLSQLNIEDPCLVNQFNSACKSNADRFSHLKVFTTSDVDITEFDASKQQNWFMPEKYKSFDIQNFLISKCKTRTEIDRVEMELSMFIHHNLIDVLKYLKYLVDTMRSNNVVWGVGRGSSVASYCLYLLDVHKIDSLKYDLDIKEFLK